MNFNVVGDFQLAHVSYHDDCWEPQEVYFGPFYAEVSDTALIPFVVIESFLGVDRYADSGEAAS